jgi:hypothetical protein
MTLAVMPNAGLENLALTPLDAHQSVRIAEVDAADAALV